jgi:hypothetical protein
VESNAAREALRSMMEAFIRGDDQSLNFVNRLERLLQDSFRHEPIYDELAEALATYTPGGGQFLINEEQLARQLRYVMDQFMKEES